MAFPFFKSRRARIAALTLAAAVLAVLAIPPVMLLWLWSRSVLPGFDEAAAGEAAFSDVAPIVPGPGLPPDIRLMPSNNNVDLARFGDRIFMAFRTAPTHFASAKTRTIVVSSLDRKKWDLEADVNMKDGDMREPRFFAFGNRLFFYFFKAGSDPLAFQPSSTFCMERRSQGNWTEPQPVGEKGQVMWCFKSRDGMAYRSVYDGSRLYDLSAQKGDLRLYRSDDGVNWIPLSGNPQVDRAHACECAFEFDDKGGLVAVVRLEGRGSLICRADAADLSMWTCKYTPFKYDSPIMLRHGDDFYVIARRSLGGQFWNDLPLVDEKLDTAYSMVRYSLTRKRTTLYKVDVDDLELHPLFDFPSRGDTAFPSIAPLDGDSYYMVNYSNPLDGPDLPWLLGQLRPTKLYETVLRFNQASTPS